jgi:sugar lactone lactonase YvrE
MDSIYSDNCVWDAKAIIGEGPVWVSENNNLYWVDINSKQILIYSTITKNKIKVDVPHKIGWAIPTYNNLNLFLCGFKNFIGKYDISNKKLEVVHELNEKYKNNRLNDAKFDSKGNLWAGTMDDDAKDDSGYFYKFPNYSTKILQDGPFKVTNGPAINKSENILYHCDSLSQIIHKYEIDDKYNLLNRSIFVKYEVSEDGFPDGITVDNEDCLWVARYGSNKITRYSPEGNPCFEIILPAKNVTSCTFGGTDLDVLYVTTARDGLNTENLVKYPLSGGLFEINLPFKGISNFYSSW